VSPAARWLLALLLTLPAAPAAAQELGRLFFSPAERAALDARRKARLPDKPAAGLESTSTRVDGYVLRSRGRPTVWVNGQAQAGEVRLGRDPAAPGRVAVPGSEGRGRTGLRVGETYDSASGEVRDVIGTGEVRVERGGAR